MPAMVRYKHRNIECLLLMLGGFTVRGACRRQPPGTVHGRDCRDEERAAQAGVLGVKG